MNIKRLIPNTITCCNLVCGSIAIYLATQGAFIWAFLLILGGAFFDFFDGMSARLLKAPSPIGLISRCYHFRSRTIYVIILLSQTPFRLVGRNRATYGSFFGSPIS